MMRVRRAHDGYSTQRRDLNAEASGIRSCSSTAGWDRPEMYRRLGCAEHPLTARIVLWCNCDHCRPERCAPQRHRQGFAEMPSALPAMYVGAQPLELLLASRRTSAYQCMSWHHCLRARRTIRKPTLLVGGFQAQGAIRLWTCSVCVAGKDYSQYRHDLWSVC